MTQVQFTGTIDDHGRIEVPDHILAALNLNNGDTIDGRISLGEGDAPDGKAFLDQFLDMEDSDA